MLNAKEYEEKKNRGEARAGPIESAPAATPARTSYAANLPKAFVRSPSLGEVEPLVAGWAAVPISNAGWKHRARSGS